jgi:hypothetical protein
MKMSDVVSTMGNHVFAEIALVIAAAGFLTVIVTTLLRRNREPFERARLMPLMDEEACRWQHHPDERQRREEALPPNRSQLHSSDMDERQRREEARRGQRHPDERQRREEALPPNRSHLHSGDLK